MSPRLKQTMKFLTFYKQLPSSDKQMPFRNQDVSYSIKSQAETLKILHEAWVMPKSCTLIVFIVAWLQHLYSLTPRFDYIELIKNQDRN